MSAHDIASMWGMTLVIGVTVAGALTLLGIAVWSMIVPFDTEDDDDAEA